MCFCMCMCMCTCVCVFARAFVYVCECARAHPTAQRYEQLAAVYDGAGMPAEAAFARAQCARACARAGPAAAPRAAVPRTGAASGTALPLTRTAD